VAPTDDDDVLDPTAHDQLAVDHVSEVSCTEPVAAAGCCRRVGIVVIAGRDRAAAQLDFADFAVLHRLPGRRVADSHPEAGSRSRRRSARAASAYAKLGPAVAVPPNSAIHSIHRAGAARKSCGAASTRSNPCSIGAPSKPMSPMSWYRGSHDTALSMSGSRAAASTAASRFAVMQRCGTMTPFGSAVAPLVHWRIASASGSSAGRSELPGA